MNILSHAEYHYYLLEQLKGTEWQCHTSELDSYGSYTKTYVCDNGLVLTEVNRPVYETITGTVKGLEITTEVKLMESELFSNKKPESVYMYQKW